MSLKNVFQKAAGLFVELPDQPAPVFDPSSLSDPGPVAPPPSKPRTVEDVVKDAPGPNLDEIKTPPETAKSPPVSADGIPDFKAIYEKSGVPAVSFGAEEAMQVIGSLPADLPIDVKRKTVGATLSAMGKAMGVTTDSVVADASRKIAALHSFTEQLTAQTNQYQAMIEQKIADLKKQIADCEAMHGEASGKLDTVVKACQAEAAKVEDVLEFFTHDAPPSKLA
ncbi:MAG TPA: hypothetical protein VKT78_11245 [Fimbriimonadaceae bacterium]|nr:hypothetical protein [Fimbriimonadaceae bacterium]